ncbi:MAG: aldo/keto reductase [Desulfobacterales bacterium]|nr:aldo/keto reductase [Desulfobacterales bacterium]MDJ0855247.1 aldo/keto reductase [Desulfobacterales bacterium]MDJ0886882.1 aldo/keto reductase [Desulfobacterales bacterium]MDJ0990415.1 aldo/keto reductase [Desulfobacterales bacterium]
MDLSQPTTLGRTGLHVGRLGLGAGYGAPAAAFEIAFERGCNYFYWTSRKSGMREAIRRIVGRGQRDRLVVALQSYARSGALMEYSLKKALKALGLDYADIFVLGWHNRNPSPRLVDRALAMRAKGLFRHLGMSGHNRPLFAAMAAKEGFDTFHVRYNAAHRGAETEVFPHLKGQGVVTYTATRWGHLLQARRMPPGEQPPSSGDCYRFALSHPSVDVCLCGPRNMEQMRSALTALDSSPMDADELARIRAIGDHVHGQRSFF